jgi:hypothetical protein
VAQLNGYYFFLVGNERQVILTHEATSQLYRLTESGVSPALKFEVSESVSTRVIECCRFGNSGL